MVLVLLAGLPQAHAASDDALDRYRKGEFEASRQEYERLAREKPDDFRLRFNAGAAAYRMDDFDGAAGLFEQVLRSPDLGLQQQGWYNLGNARYRAGEAEQDPDKKREQWQQALSSYTAALKLNPGDPSAQANYQAVKQAIESTGNLKVVYATNVDKETGKCSVLLMPFADDVVYAQTMVVVVEVVMALVAAVLVIYTARPYSISLIME